KHRGLMGGWSWGPEGNKAVEVVPGVVPEGVAKVTLLYPHHRGVPASVTVAVVNNVFAAFVPYATLPTPPETRAPLETQAGYVPPRPTKGVWRPRKGEVLKNGPF